MFQKQLSFAGHATLSASIAKTLGSAARASRSVVAHKPTAPEAPRQERGMSWIGEAFAAWASADHTLH